MGRFLNIDAYVSTGQGILANNIFAYCNNNPVNVIDPNGNAALQQSSISDDPFRDLFFGSGGGGGGGSSAVTQSAASMLLSAVAVGTVIAIGSKQEEKADSTKILVDVKVKQQKEDAKLYQLAYVNQWGMLVRVGKKMTFTEALAALGISGAVNSVSKIYEYDRAGSSTAQRSLEHLGTGNWGIYTYSQSAAKALAFVFGCTAPPEVHGWGMYGHYHDSTHTFHIWFGGCTILLSITICYLILNPIYTVREIIAIYLVLRKLIGGSADILVP